MGCNTSTVVLAHCQQIISHTPTGMAADPTSLGANKIAGDSWRYRVDFFHTTKLGGGEKKRGTCEVVPSRPPAGKGEQCPQTFHSR